MAWLQYDRIILVLFLLFIFERFRKSLRERQFQRFAQMNNCRPPSHSANMIPWGIDRMWRLVRLTGEGADVLENIIMPSFRDNGWTFRSSGLFGEEFLLTADPANLRAVFATKFKDFVTGQRRAGAFGYMVGKCIFTTDGMFWEHSRALFRPHFMTGQINDLEATERAVQDLFHALKTVDDGDWTKEVDLQTLFLRFTLDTGTEFLFGANVKSQLAAIPGALPYDMVDETTRVAADNAGGDMSFTEAFHISSVEVTKRAKLQGLYWLADSRKARKAVLYLQKFIDHLVKNTLHPSGAQKMRDEEQEQAGKSTLLRTLARDTQDPVELRDQVLFMLVAARDTTAALLTWMFLMLTKHPAVFQSLKAAIVEDFGITDAPKNISFNTLKKCRYLQWVMYETLRLYPPGPLNSRVAARDTILPTGGGPDGNSPIAVKKGQTVNLCVYAMQRRIDLWGKDALDFIPERWEKRKSDWNFLPFSAGPRTCLGQQYALTEAGYLTVRLLQRFDEIHALDNLAQIAQTVTVTLEAKNRVNVRLRKAS